MGIRVLLVDDHTVVRQGFRRILETDEALEIVGEASDGAHALALAAERHPDVVVMDISLPQLNGIEVTRRLVAHHAPAKVLILTMHGDDAIVRHSLHAGARGYLLKDAEDLDLVRAVKAIAGGGSAFSPLIAKVVLAGYLGDAAGRDRADNLARLTDREREVLQLIAEGKVHWEIATRLSVPMHAVEHDRRSIMAKLDLRTTADLVRFALRRKIVT